MKDLNIARNNKNFIKLNNGRFTQIPEGSTIRMPVTALVPSQPDDGLPSKSKGPIPVALIDGQAILVEGNHRYHARRKLIQPNSTLHILVKKSI